MQFSACGNFPDSYKKAIRHIDGKTLVFILKKATYNGLADVLGPTPTHSYEKKNNYNDIKLQTCFSRLSRLSCKLSRISD